MRRKRRSLENRLMNEGQRRLVDFLRRLPGIELTAKVKDFSSPALPLLFAFDEVDFEEQLHDSLLPVIQFEDFADALPIFNVEATFSSHDERQIALGRNAGPTADEGQRYFALMAFVEFIETPEAVGGGVGFEEDAVNVVLQVAHGFFLPKSAQIFWFCMKLRSL
jgi:hypothetical protein